MTRHKFETLDGLRGVAALGVVLFHVAGPLHMIARGSYLAVDLFFLMSGFVVAAAYEQRLLSGWSVADFMIVRLKRLWPLYILGIVFGLSSFMVIPLLRPEVGVILPHMPLAQTVAMSLLFLPQFVAYGGPAFPLNSASWSLSVEVFGNLAYAVLARSLRTRMLIAATLIGLVGTALVAIKSSDLNVGISPGNVMAGYIRFLFSFPLGVLLYRFHAAGKLPVLSMPAWLPLALAAFTFSGIGPQGAVRDVLIVALLFPAILVGSISGSVPHRLTKIFAWAGAVSYPLYILHWPLVAMIPVLVHGPEYLPISAALVVTVVLIAAIVERYFDRPLQKWLRKPMATSPVENAAR
ncbi:MAG TPA: acyltransferase [Rhizomicrobium sp.]|jgi:peptidoglycan/LPS O-acetylase OafA/YrhL|nr:acyltransferase [Rhizomicrobium sp.]